MSKGSRRLEIERRLALFHANRPMIIARDFGVSTAWVLEVSSLMQEKLRANPAPRTAAPKGDSQPLGNGPCLPKG